MLFTHKHPAFLNIWLCSWNRAVVFEGGPTHPSERWRARSPRSARSTGGQRELGLCLSSCTAIARHKGCRRQAVAWRVCTGQRTWPRGGGLVGSVVLIDWHSLFVGSFPLFYKLRSFRGSPKIFSHCQVCDERKDMEVIQSEGKILPLHFMSSRSRGPRPWWL